MNEAVLISIRPWYCWLILNGKKRIEVRKAKPKLKPPFKCYIYCTKEHSAYDRLWIFGKKAREQFGTSVNIAHLCGAKDVGGAYKGNGKVIGEFVCDVVYQRDYAIHDFDTITLEELSEFSCVSEDELLKYGDLRPLYGWHISDLVIYDKPKELGEFRGRKLAWRGNNHIHVYEELTRPPQSWSYVKELCA